MKKYILIVISLVVIATLFSCTSYCPPEKYYFEKTKDYNKSYEDVWSKLVKFFSQNNIPLRTLEKNSGYIASELYLTSSLILDCYDCGKEGSGQYIKENIGNFNVVVEKINDNNTKVTITTFFKALLEDRSFGVTSETMDCNSTGKLEREILDYIEK